MVITGASDAASNLIGPVQVEFVGATTSATEIEMQLEASRINAHPKRK
jgi:hypothetical protein